MLCAHICADDDDDGGADESQKNGEKNMCTHNRCQWTPENEARSVHIA